jgi:outer membrane protein assembly factor BamB
MRHRLLLVLLSSVMLGGCASWFETSSRPLPTPLTAIQTVQALKIQWSERADAAAPGSFLPVYDRGDVLVANPDGRILVLNADTGRESGRINLGRRLSSGVAVSGNVLLAGTEDGYLLAADRTSGKKLWEQRLSSVTLEAPAAGPQVVTVRTNDDRLAGFQISDGKQLWTQSHFMPDLIVRNTGSMTAVGGDAVLVGLAGGKMQVISPTTGNVLWEGVVSTPKGATELERVTDVVSRPQLQGQQVCAVAYQGRLACFDAHGGNLMWAHEVSSSKPVVMDDRYVYVSDEDDSVQAFDRATGRSIWKQDALKYRTLSGPVLLGRFILVADAEGVAHLLSNEDGSVVGRIETGIEGQPAQPLMLGSSALIRGPNGRLVMLTLG